jgi:hypothetical protein
MYIEQANMSFCNLNATNRSVTSTANTNTITRSQQPITEQQWYPGLDANNDTVVEINRNSYRLLWLYLSKRQQILGYNLIKKLHLTLLLLRTLAPQQVS